MYKHILSDTVSAHNRRQRIMRTLAVINEIVALALIAAFILALLWGTCAITGNCNVAAI